MHNNFGQIQRPTADREDFPALGTVPTAATAAAAPKMMSGRQTWQQQQILPNTIQPPVQQQAAPPTTNDRFGLMGLLGVIRMTDPDLNTLALGCDLTTLGLNLNATEPLQQTFLSPWPEQPMDIASYTLPACYDVPQMPPSSSKLSYFSDETLFYIFYTADEMQEMAAGELIRRNWRYHKTMKVWITKESVEYELLGDGERGVYIFWDVQHWGRVSKEFEVHYSSIEGGVWATVE